MSSASSTPGAGPQGRLRRLSGRLSGRLPAMVGAASMIAVVTLAARAFGFLRWFAQSTWVGADAVGNAYASANQIPNVVFEVAVGGALAGATVPLLAGPVAHKLKDKVNDTASALLTWSLVILVPLAALVWASADFLVSLLPVSKGSDAAMQNALAGAFLRVFAVQIPLYGISIVLTGILQSHKKFFWPALAPLLSSLVTIATYAAYGALSGGHDHPPQIPVAAIEVLAWGTTAGVVALSVPLFVPVWRLGVRLRINFKMEKDLLRRTLLLGGAGIGALLAQQAAVLTNLFLVRWGGEVGSVNVFQYAQAVYVLPYAVLAVPVCTAVFPHLTELQGNNDRLGFNKVAAKATRSVVSVSLLGAAALVALGPAAEDIFSWRKPAAGMAIALLWLAPSLLGYALLYHLSRVLYALDCGPAAVSGAVIGWMGTALTSTLAVSLLSPAGGNGPATLQGLAIGQTVGMTAGALFLLVAVARKAGRGAQAGLLRTCLIMIPAAALAAASGRFLYFEALQWAGQISWLLTGVAHQATGTAPSHAGNLAVVCFGALIAGFTVLLICLAGITLGLRGLVPLRRRAARSKARATAPTCAETSTAPSSHEQEAQ